MLKNVKGYIGPVGDDLPSLVPLIFALLVFFASFYSAHAIYRQTSANFALTSNAMGITSFLQSDREIDDYAEFEYICRNLNPRGYNFRAGIVEFKQPFERIDIYAFVNEGSRIFSQDGNFFSCPLEPEQKLKLNSRVVVHMVPVSYKDNSALRKPITKPMLLVVVVWE